MTGPTNFPARLAAVRSSRVLAQVKSDGSYRNGQLLAGSDDVSNWDNYDRYFKFYSIYVDEQSYNRS